MCVFSFYTSHYLILKVNVYLVVCIGKARTKKLSYFNVQANPSFLLKYSFKSKDINAFFEKISIVKLKN